MMSFTIGNFLFYFILFLSQSEREEFETEFRQKYEREKILLTEENKKLSNELDKVSADYLSPEFTTTVCYVQIGQ